MCPQCMEKKKLNLKRRQAGRGIAEAYTRTSVQASLITCLITSLVTSLITSLITSLVTSLVVIPKAGRGHPHSVTVTGLHNSAGHVPVGTQKFY